MRGAVWSMTPFTCCVSVALLSVAVRAMPPEAMLRELDPHPAPAAFASSSSPREGAVSGGFPASGITMLSRVTVAQLRGSLNATATNDIWGYVSPSGREYAIVGLNVGTALVEVTDPVNPVVVATLPDASSIWSDMKTYQTFAYNVNESGGGMQIIALGGIDDGVVNLWTPLTDSGFQTAHNVVVDEVSGYAYLCGANIGNGLIAVDLANPRIPVIAGAWFGPYVHDAQVVTYTEGPYAGRQIAFCFCGGAGLFIVDVTDKNNMFTLGSLQYPNVTYCHQGWVSEDRQTLYVDDELDELQDPDVSTTTTYVVDIQDLSNPQFVTSYTNGLGTIDHNLFVRGDYIFLSNYTSGLRVYDATDRNNLQEIGFFDTYPANNSLSFSGSWGNYPYLPSGVVLVTDQSNGLFVLDVSAIVPQPCTGPSTPFAEPGDVAKNRYVSFMPLNPGKQTALSVELTQLPPGFEALEGTTMWVDAPQTVATSGGTMHIARLRCDPLYRDWGDVDTIHLYGPEVLPGGTYTIQAYENADCGQGLQLLVSGLLNRVTSPDWGDVVGDVSGGPDGTADFADISAVVLTFQGAATGPSIAASDLAPDIPDQTVNFIDISAAVMAFQGASYPYAGPSGCP